MIELSELRTLSLLGGLTDKELEVVSGIAEKKAYTDNAVIFLEGMPGEALYVLLKGKVKITKMLEEGAEKEITSLGAGDSFGEFALLDPGPRLVTVRVSEMAEILIIKRKDAGDLMDREPLIYSKLVSNIARLFAARLRDSGDRIKEIMRG